LEQFLDFFHVLFSVGASGIAFGGRKTHLALTVGWFHGTKQNLALIVARHARDPCEMDVRFFEKPIDRFLIGFWIPETN
jgi:hypothetical protein